MINIIHGNCRDELPKIEANLVDSIVTDPPAGIAFMGKGWDKNRGGRDKWIIWMSEIASECMRALKPGGHALVWAIPKTSHWTATAWENAGFELRDKIFHGFGSGFPKSQDISKVIDKAAGAEREIIGKRNPYLDGAIHKYSKPSGSFLGVPKKLEDGCVPITAPATENAKQWDGWGTGLKPAVEEWLLLRKPISESTVAKNVVKWNVGALNIDRCRIDFDKHDIHDLEQRQNSKTQGKPGNVQLKALNMPCKHGVKNKGRYPASFTHDGSPELLELFPYTKKKGGGFNKGTASRYFYCSKPSKRDRDGGLEKFELKSGSELLNRIEGSKGLSNPRAGAGRNNGMRNTHPTVKSTDLMRYLCRLITPPYGLVLDPFCGSGSTGKACAFEGFDFIGIEKELEYVNIANARIQYVLDGCPEIKKPEYVPENQTKLF